MSNLVKTLLEILPADAAVTGGKAFNCARLKQTGFSVPDGIVLTTAAVGGSLDLPELRQWLEALPAGTLLAVRSSATEEDSVEHSFAGIHETTLNVRPENVFDAIRSCWASVRSPAALAYRRARNLATEDLKIAVLIQCMVQAKVSGVAFTVNPVSGSHDEMLINSVQGLGEDLVSGRVEPDQFIVEKRASPSGRGRGEAAGEGLIRDLASLLLRIEAFFGSPQDVEWCYDGSQFWIVQSRPVTSGTSRHKKDIEWTRANAREVMPELASPISIYGIAEAIERAQREFFGKLLAPESELGKPTQVFYGRMYFNVDQVRYSCALVATPPAAFLRSLGHSEDIDPADEVITRAPVSRVVAALPDLLRTIGRQLTLKRRVLRWRAHNQRFLEDVQSLDFVKSSDSELWSENRNWRPRLRRTLEIVFTLTSIASYQFFVEQICKAVGMPYERLLHSHLAAGEKSVSSQQAFDLLRLVQVARRNGDDLSSAEFRSEFEIFLQKYGHRGRYESEISNPRYAEDPSTLLFAIRSHLQSAQQLDPDEIIRRQESEAASAWQEFQQKLTPFQRITIARRARWLLKRLKQMYIWRELVRSEFTKVAFVMRKMHLELARRFVERGWIESRDDYFYLTLPELDEVMDRPEYASSLKSIIARRKSEWARYAKLDMPLLMKESQLPAIARNFYTTAPHAEAASMLHGLCVSAGYAEGEVVVMRDPREFSRMKPRAILVAPATDPSWTPLFTLASGVIVEVGGILSHASTVAREYGLPALANVKRATEILKDGDHVRLDATNGIVEITGDATLP